MQSNSIFVKVGNGTRTHNLQCHRHECFTIALWRHALYVDCFSEIAVRRFFAVIFNKKCRPNFYWGILTLKGSLLSGALMLKRFIEDLRVKVWRFFGPETPHSEFEGTKPSKGTCINRNTTFEPLSVQFGPKLQPVGWPRKQKKRKKKPGD